MAIFITLDTTTKRNNIESKNFGIKSLATGYLILSERKEEEHARLNEIPLMMIDVARAFPGGFFIDTNNWSINWGRDSRKGSQLEWEPICSCKFSASGSPMSICERAIILPRLMIGETKGSTENTSFAWSRRILSHKDRKSILSFNIQVRVFLSSIRSRTKNGRKVTKIVIVLNVGW